MRCIELSTGLSVVGPGLHNLPMTITTGPPPRPQAPGPLSLARAFLTGAVTGGCLAAFVVGTVIENVPLIVAALVVPLVYGLLLALATLPRRRREAAVVPRTALALIEDVEAVGGESGDIPVRFELSVNPEEGPAFRVEIRQDVNLVDLPDYRAGGVVVVQYPPDRPWKTRIVKRPTPEWTDRAARTKPASASGPVLGRELPGGCAGGFLVLLGLLLAAGAVVLAFRADLFDSKGSADSTRPSVSSSTSTETTTVTSASGTVTLGAGQSMLDQGELRKSVGSLTADKDGRRALTLVVTDRTLSVVFAPDGTRTPGFDPDSLPFDRIPALVKEAGGGSTWELTADGLTGSLSIRVVVTGADGPKFLQADGTGKVVRRGTGS